MIILKRHCWVVVVVVVFVLLMLSTAVHAQTIKIKLVDGHTGRPMTNTGVNTWVGSERKQAMALPTGKEGVAWLYLTDKDAPVNAQQENNTGADHPIVRYADTIWIVAGYIV